EAGAVECRASSGALLFRINGLASPYTLAADCAGGRMWGGPARGGARGGRVWVALASGDALAAFDGSGAPAGRISGIPRPRGIATDPRNGEVWVTALGSEDGDGRLLHYDAAGGLIST